MKLAAECPTKKNRSNKSDRESDERRAKDGSGSSHTEETVNGVEEEEKVSKKKNRAEGNNKAQLRW